MGLWASLPAQESLDSLNNEVQMIDIREMRSQDSGDTLTSSELLRKIQALAGEFLIHFLVTTFYC